MRSVAPASRRLSGGRPAHRFGLGSFAPAGLSVLPHNSVPRLTPWALFWRRSAARRFQYSVAPASRRLSGGRPAHRFGSGSFALRGFLVPTILSHGLRRGLYSGAAPRRSAIRSAIFASLPA